MDKNPQNIGGKIRKMSENPPYFARVDNAVPCLEEFMLLHLQVVPLHRTVHLPGYHRVLG